MPAQNTALSRAFHAPLSRADHFITETILWLVAAAGLVTAMWGLWPTDVLEVNRATDTGAAAPVPAGVADNVRVAWAPEQVWTLLDPTYGQQLLVRLPGVVGALCVVAAALLLLDLARRMRRDQAFTVEALRRLRALALLVTFGGLLLPFVRMGCGLVLSGQLQAEPGVLFTVRMVEFAPILVGMLLLALGEVFARGIRLADDVDGLV